MSKTAGHIWNKNNVCINCGFGKTWAGYKSIDCPYPNRKKPPNPLAGKVTKVDKYRSKPTVDAGYNKVRVVLTLDLPKDKKLYRLFKKLKEIS